MRLFSNYVALVECNSHTYGTVYSSCVYLSAVYFVFAEKTHVGNVILNVPTFLKLMKQYPIDDVTVVDEFYCCCDHHRCLTCTNTVFATEIYCISLQLLLTGKSQSQMNADAHVQCFNMVTLTKELQKMRNLKNLVS